MTRSVTKKIQTHSDSAYRGPSHVHIPRLPTRAIPRPRNMPVPTDPYGYTRPRNTIFVSPKGRRKSAAIARAQILSLLHSSPDGEAGPSSDPSDQLPAFVNSNDTPAGTSSSTNNIHSQVLALTSSDIFMSDSEHGGDVADVADTSEEEYEGKGKGKRVEKDAVAGPSGQTLNQAKLAVAYGIEYELRKRREIEKMAEQEKHMFNLNDSDKENASIVSQDGVNNAGPGQSTFKTAWANFETNVLTLADSVKDHFQSDLTTLVNGFKDAARKQVRVDMEAEILGSALVSSGQDRIDQLEGEKSQLLEDQREMHMEVTRLKEELARARAEVQGFREALAPLQKLA